MENKRYSNDCITLDGRMDEAVWAEVPEQTGFSVSKNRGGALHPVQTYFKFIPCEDRLYVGVKCDEPNMPFITRINPGLFMWHADAVELFLAPTGNYYDFYHFTATIAGGKAMAYYSEGGNIQPDPYEPEWNFAVYKGEDFWSVEFELPLTAFYMTPQRDWSDKWLVNVCRTHNIQNVDDRNMYYTSWSPMERHYKETKTYPTLGGFPIRNARDDVRISRVLADITEKREDGYHGMLTVTASVPETRAYTFSSEATEPFAVTLQQGINDIRVPCIFKEGGRIKLPVKLVREADSHSFARTYPVFATYEPIKLELTRPEYRTNFYPGQDASRIVGKVIAAGEITVTIEGPGIPKQSVKTDAEGNFAFDTPNFEYGDAILTITNSLATLTKKIRRLAPTGHTMTWISGGNLIVNGKPTLRRNMYAEYYMGGEAFKLKYDADDLHQTPEFAKSVVLEPFRLLKGADSPGGEALKDAPPSAEMMDRIRKRVDENMDTDFGYYYITDEPECRGLSPIYLKYIYDYVTERDPYHVILSASREADKHIEIADWFEAHPYISPYTTPEGKRMYNRAINTVGDCVECITKLNRSDKCIGFLPTCFASMASCPEPYPTLDEMICHTWAAMIRGGKSLWPYVYYDLNDRASVYEGMRYVFTSFEALEELVLLARRTTLIRNPHVEGVRYELDGEKMFVLVNLTNEVQTVTLDGLTGEWFHFRHGGTLSGNTFALKPLEVIVGTSECKDAGLPSYAEVAALVDKTEAARRQNKSLLFERQKDIEFTASSNTLLVRKLFDGVSDNLGWRQEGTGDKFLEMDVTKIAPTFQTVVVSGWNIADLEIKVRNGGELTTPAMAKRTVDGLTVTFELPEAITPHALRLEMHSEFVELYEVEIF